MTKDIKDINVKDLEKFNNDFESTPSSSALARTVQQNGVTTSSKNYAEKRQLKRVFSIDLETSAVTDQKKSGRC